ncbi:EcsC family protein [Ruegeria faecimaris]|uniref:EcsC family protein n=1 Tax=Ruegeria faecimaris TaxID=686389 RepID=UPI00232CA8E3|nr:EcsC family protein [Ruegeria faecimaris]
MGKEIISQKNIVDIVTEAMKQCREYEEERASFLAQGLSSITGPLGSAVSSVVPGDWLRSSVELADDAAALSLPSEQFSHDFMDLPACEDAATSVGYWASGQNAVSGGFAGWFGLAGMAADVPTTITLAARNVRATAAAYGFDEDSEYEKAFRLMVLDLATSMAEESREESLEKVNQLSRMLTSPKARILWDGAGRWVADTVFERVARQMGANLIGRKAAQVVPIVGGVVAAAVNASFQNDVNRAARYAYRLRWLMQQNLIAAPLNEGE